MSIVRLKGKLDSVREDVREHVDELDECSRVREHVDLLLPSRGKWVIRLRFVLVLRCSLRLGKRVGGWGRAARNERASPQRVEELLGARFVRTSLHSTPATH